MKTILAAIAVPALAVYCYAATILTNYGFLTYFNIPSSFVQSSLSINIIFFYQYFIASWELLAGMHWYVLFAIGGAMGVMLGLYYFVVRYKEKWRTGLIALMLLLAFLWLGSFFTLGKVIAANQTNILVVASGCPSLGSAAHYVVTVIDSNEVVLVPINQNNKIIGGFLVENPSDFSCGFEYQEIGKILQ